MKKLMISAIFMTLWFSVHAQLTVESELSGNELNCTLETGDPMDPGLEDLFFSISPNGIPQYGRKVQWNLWPGTNDETRYYRVKKGKWGRAAISDLTVPVQFTEGVSADPASTPNMDLRRNWVKLSKAWNFSNDAYNIVVLSIKNQGLAAMNEARVTFSYPHSDMNVSEVKIYNNWASIEGVQSNAENEIYTLVFNDLLPSEIRHLYFYIDISRKNKRELKEDFLLANLQGHQQVRLKANRTNPPHDPNALILVNSILNTPPIYDCAPFADHPVLEDVCASGVPFWYDNQGVNLEMDCTFFNSKFCDLPYSLDYPYCNIDQERMVYQMTCLNDGQGPARKVIMRTTFGEAEVFEKETFAVDDFSHTLLDFWRKPEAEFIFEEINLPGLNDPEVVYMYDECTAQVTFSLNTRCRINEEITAAGLIEFYDAQNNLADDLETNRVTAVPEQGEYDNIIPNCMSCVHKRAQSVSEKNSEKYLLSTSEGNDYVTISRLTTGAPDFVDTQIALSIIDVSGRVIMQQSISVTQLDAGHRIDVSHLPSGIYILSGLNGENRFARKFLR